MITAVAIAVSAHTMLMTQIDGFAITIDKIFHFRIFRKKVLGVAKYSRDDVFSELHDCVVSDILIVHFVFG